jgi:hypothetical protein
MLRANHGPEQVDDQCDSDDANQNVFHNESHPLAGMDIGDACAEKENRSCDENGVDHGNAP